MYVLPYLLQVVREEDALAEAQCALLPGDVHTGLAVVRITRPGHPVREESVRALAIILSQYFSDQKQ